MASNEGAVSGVIRRMEKRGASPPPGVGTAGSEGAFNSSAPRRASLIGSSLCWSAGVGALSPAHAHELARAHLRSQASGAGITCIGKIQGLFLQFQTNRDTIVNKDSIGSQSMLVIFRILL